MWLVRRLGDAAVVQWRVRARDICSPIGTDPQTPTLCCGGAPAGGARCDHVCPRPSRTRSGPVARMLYAPIHCTSGRARVGVWVPRNSGLSILVRLVNRKGKGIQRRAELPLSAGGFLMARVRGAEWGGRGRPRCRGPGAVSISKSRPTGGRGESQHEHATGPARNKKTRLR